MGWQAVFLQKSPHLASVQPSLGVSERDTHQRVCWPGSFEGPRGTKGLGKAGCMGALEELSQQDGKGLRKLFGRCELCSGLLRLSSGMQTQGETSLNVFFIMRSSE